MVIRWRFVCHVALSLALSVAVGCGRVSEPQGGDAGADVDSGGGCEACAFGCASDGASCADLLPSNGLSVALERAAQQQVLSVPGGATMHFDTDEGRFECEPTFACDIEDSAFVVVEQSDGVDIAAFVFASLTIESGAVVTASGERALALVADSDIRIDGTLDLRPFEVGVSAPSRGVGSRPAEPATNGEFVDDGEQTTGSGGGGGPGGPGAQGGAARASGGTSVPGSAAGSSVDVPDLTPLVGGRAGGLTEGGACNDLAGGGGGAVQIVSRTDIIIGEDGVINAGGGGARGTFCSGSQVGGGGGGGAILLEAAVVRLHGVTAANGGGGGSRHAGRSSPGESGRADTVAAQGAPGDDGPPGGNGAARTSAPTEGGSADTENLSGGGGGGGIGAIRVHTAHAAGLRIGTAHLSSPSISEGAASTRD